MSEQGVGLVEREALGRVRARVAALNVERFRLLEDVAELERLGVAQLTGDRSTERLLPDVCHLDRSEATRLVDEAADLTARCSLLGEPLPPRLPTTALVLADGAIGAGHVAVIRKTMGRLDTVDTVTGEEWAHAERFLATEATGLTPRGLGRLAAELLARLDPDGAVPEEDAGRFDEVRIGRGRDGSFRMTCRFHDPADGEMFREGLDVLSTPAGPDDDRSLPNRHAGALKEVFADAFGAGGLVTDTRRDQDSDTGPDAELDAPSNPDATQPGEDGEDALIPEPRRAEPPSPASPPAGPVRGPVRPLLTITMDHRWLQLAIGHGTLESGALVSAATVRRWACDAEIVPLVLGSRSEPLDIGRRSRLIPDAMRRALNIRDRGCAFPGCTRRPRRCEAHHVDHWGDFGPTALDNLTLLCRHHHQLIHHGHWTVEMIDGLPWFTPPSWVDPDRRPRPGGQRRLLRA